ncbi:Oidioi.mRNA.OKI2018_I69.chr2.g7212.t1.cds [Oikopleura dioica]|uniref:Oidioi.mRNA.OKI2018_I69.chr2.g7212.t1.cds n=1 Tax=Oikopleura dioica TaxID=34765 RepID=A0ABN7TEI8_OIKDI|nr:Oidioi.mRNA.OKI2018_I69.chr2.g7212.t1.cds [Oikopleura dioica]
MRDTDTEDEPRSSSASSLGIPIDSLSIENISSKKKEEKIELDYSRSKSRRVESGSESDASKNDMFTFREISKFCARAHHSFNAKPHMTMSFSEWSGNEYSLLLSDLQREKENLEKKQSEAKIRPFSSSKLHTRRSSKKLKSAHSTPNVNTYLRKNTSSGTISEGMPSGYNDFMRKKVALSVAVQDIHYQFQHFPHTNSHIGHYRDTVTRKIISVAMEQQSPSVLNASPKRLTSALSEIPGSLKLLDRKAEVLEPVANAAKPLQVNFTAKKEGNSPGKGKKKKSGTRKGRERVLGKCSTGATREAKAVLGAQLDFVFLKGHRSEKHKKGKEPRLEPCTRKISQPPSRNQEAPPKSQPKNFPEHPEHSSGYFKPRGIQQKRPVRDPPPVERPLDFGDLVQTTSLLRKVSDVKLPPLRPNL